MFALSIALLGFALIAAMFALTGVAGASAGVAAIVAGMLAVFTMVVYWRRRPRETAKAA